MSNNNDTPEYSLCGDVIPVFAKYLLKSGLVDTDSEDYQMIVDLASSPCKPILCEHEWEEVRIPVGNYAHLIRYRCKKCGLITDYK